MSDYFLIARYRKKNDYKVLRLNDKWFLDEKRATGQEFRANDLEAIDIVTSNFKDRKSFITRLYQNGYINDPCVDIVIASKKKKDGKQYIRFDEVIYKSKEQRRAKALRTIAQNSLNGNMSEDKQATGAIYDGIISTVYFSDDFYEMIMDGETNISKRFANLLSEIPSYEEIPYDLKYEHSFDFKSYRELRNVVEAIVRLEKLGLFSRDNLASVNQDFIDENYEGRLALVPRLSLELDKDYCEGQLSFFDYFENRDKELVDEATKIVANEEKTQHIVPVTEEKKTPATINEMPREIFRVLENVPSNLFWLDGNKWRFNTKVFKHPILEEEKKQLDGLLTGNMPKFFMDYSRHKRQLQETRRIGEYHEAEELSSCCERDKSLIRKRFKSTKCIVDTYKWCMLYEGCKKRDAAYATSGINVGSEDVDAKIFGKKQ